MQQAFRECHNARSFCPNNAHHENIVFVGSLTLLILLGERTDLATVEDLIQCVELGSPRCRPVQIVKMLEPTQMSLFIDDTP